MDPMIERERERERGDYYERKKKQRWIRWWRRPFG